MTLRLARLPQAQEDHYDIWARIALDSLKSADDVLDEFLKAERLLCDFPLIGQARDDLAPGLRHWPVRDFLIFYKAEDDELVIVRIHHGARDLPGLFEA